MKTCTRVAPKKNCLRKLSNPPASGAPRRQARKFIQGTSPVEMKMIREQILCRCKIPRGRHIRNLPAPHRLRGAKAISNAMATRPI